MNEALNICLIVALSLIPNHWERMNRVTHGVILNALAGGILHVTSSGVSPEDTDKENFGAASALCKIIDIDEKSVFTGDIKWTGKKGNKHASKYIEEYLRVLDAPEDTIFICYLSSYHEFYICRMGSYHSIEGCHDVGLYYTRKPKGAKDPNPLLTKEQIDERGIKEYWPATTLTRKIEVIGRVLKKDYKAFGEENGWEKGREWANITGLENGVNSTSLTA